MVLSIPFVSKKDRGRTSSAGLNLSRLSLNQVYTYSSLWVLLRWLKLSTSLEGFEARSVAAMVDMDDVLHEGVSSVFMLDSSSTL